MDRETLQARLGEVAFAADLPVEILAALAAIAQPASYSAGATIFREGTVDQNLYLIVKGHIALEMQVPGRDRVRLVSLGAGDMLAWSALLGAGQMTASAVAVEATEVIRIPATSILDLCASRSDFGYEIMRRMSLALAKRLLATRLQLLDLFSAEAVPARA